MARERKKEGLTIGSLAFTVGVILAIILGFIPLSNALLVTLVIIGLIVGFFNISEKEVTPFLTSGTVLVIVTALGSQAVSALQNLRFIGGIFDALLLIFVPATIVVAIKNVYVLAKD